MNSTTQTNDGPEFDGQMTFRLPTHAAVAIGDGARVRLGGQGPAFRHPSVTDAGRVRLGGQGPLFR